MVSKFPPEVIRPGFGAEGTLLRTVMQHVLFKVPVPERKIL